MSSDELKIMRHSASHLLAAAVMELWPQTKLAIGPASEEGFYYDFDFVSPISESDLPKIEAGKNQNPTLNTLKKMAKSFEISIDKSIK